MFVERCERHSVPQGESNCEKSMQQAVIGVGFNKDEALVACPKIFTQLKT
jgi:hypothetical protein